MFFSEASYRIQGQTASTKAIWGYSSSSRDAPHSCLASFKIYSKYKFQYTDLCFNPNVRVSPAPSGAHDATTQAQQRRPSPPGSCLSHAQSRRRSTRDREAATRPPAAEGRAVPRRCSEVDRRRRSRRYQNAQTPISPHRRSCR